MTTGCSPMSSGRSVRRNQRSPEARQYRHLYSLSAWRGPNGVRHQVLARDGYQCQEPSCGVLLIGRHPAPNSPAVHHLEDHKGDIRLFLDPANCSARCKACHDRLDQQRAHGTAPLPIDEDGWPIDPRYASAR